MSKNDESSDARNCVLPKWAEGVTPKAVEALFRVVEANPPAIPDGLTVEERLNFARAMVGCLTEQVRAAALANVTPLRATVGITARQLERVLASDS